MKHLVEFGASALFAVLVIGLACGLGILEGVEPHVLLALLFAGALAGEGLNNALAALRLLRESR